MQFECAILHERVWFIVIIGTAVMQSGQRRLCILVSLQSFKNK